MFSLPIPLLLVITVVTSFLTSFLRGGFTKNTSSQNVDLMRYNFLQNSVCTVAIAVLFLISGGLGDFDAFSVIMGVLMGFTVAFSIQFNIQAYTVGPFSYTTVIVALGAVIPTLSGPLFFGDVPLSLAQWLGIALMIVCIILSPDKSKNDGNKANVKWLVLSLSASVINGLIGIIQKAHQTNQAAKDEMPALLISCFLTASLISGIIYLKEKKKSKTQMSALTLKKLIALPIITGVVFAFPHSLNLWLAGALPTAVMFPVVNLCPMMLTMISAVVIFKERLSKSQWIGIAVGIASTVLVSGIMG